MVTRILNEGAIASNRVVRLMSNMNPAMKLEIVSIVCVFFNSHSVDHLEKFLNLLIHGQAHPSSDSRTKSKSTHPFLGVAGFYLLRLNGWTTCGDRCVFVQRRLCRRVSYTCLREQCCLSRCYLQIKWTNPTPSN